METGAGGERLTRREKSELALAGVAVAAVMAWVLYPAVAYGCPEQGSVASGLRLCGFFTAALFLGACIDMLPHAIWDTEWMQEQRYLASKRRLDKLMREAEEAQAQDDADADWGGPSEWALD